MSHWCGCFHLFSTWPKLDFRYPVNSRQYPVNYPSFSIIFHHSLSLPREVRGPIIIQNVSHHFRMHYLSARKNLLHLSFQTMLHYFRTFHLLLRIISVHATSFQTMLNHFTQMLHYIEAFFETNQGGIGSKWDGYTPSKREIRKFLRKGTTTPITPWE